MALAPSTENFVLGKGVPYFSRKLDDGSYEGERDLGNTTDMTLSSDVKFIEHYSSRSGMKQKDKKIAEQVDAKISFTLDEVNTDNLALWAMGDTEAVTQAADTALTVEFASKKGRYFDLGYRNVLNVAITGKTEGEDFVVDAEVGRIFIPEDSTIVDDADTTVTFDCETASYTKIKGLKETEIEGFFRFVSDNPVGQNFELKVWRVLLSPSGDLSLIGDNWMELKFEGELMADQNNHADNPYYEVNEL